MPRAQGARAQMALAFESVYGAPPAGGWFRMPFASASLGAEQPLLSSELLSYGRDPLPPVNDAVTADGDVVVPIDVEAFGVWLKAAFGQPTTTGSGPYTHEFRTGGWTLPSLAIETAMPEVPRYAMYAGCVLDQISWTLQRSGLLTATARLVAQGETVGTVTGAGAPADFALKRFGHFNGAITRNGSPLGNVVSAERRPGLRGSLDMAVPLGSNVSKDMAVSTPGLAISTTSPTSSACPSAAISARAGAGP